MNTFSDSFWYFFSVLANSHKMKYLFIFLFLFSFFKNTAQNPNKLWTDALETRYSVLQPVTDYVLTIDSADLSYFSVDMHLLHVPDTFKVAMVAHPEYDDHYYRYVSDFTVKSKNGPGEIKRMDSAVWEVIGRSDEVFLHYKIVLPPQRSTMRAAWRPFLSPTGGLVGGPHSFMYVVGKTLAPSHVQFRIPAGWQIATGLQPTADPGIYFAPSVFVLTDCPALLGKIHTWPFLVGAVPHRIVYCCAQNASRIDSAELVHSVSLIVKEAAELFGRLPYREYSFLLQENAYGALEHSNSVTLGIESGENSVNLNRYLEEIGHEYFHAWNIVRIHPQEYGDVAYHTPPYSTGLWWSEGLTMFYADLLLRRAGLPPEDSSRKKHLEHLLERYYDNPGNLVFSAEKVSLSAYAPNGMLGDYFASTHLQGELLGAMMDLIIRDKTMNRLSIDDVIDVSIVFRMSMVRKQERR